MEEGDSQTSLLERLRQHAIATATYSGSTVKAAMPTMFAVASRTKPFSTFADGKLPLSQLATGIFAI